MEQNGHAFPSQDEPEPRDDLGDFEELSKKSSSGNPADPGDEEGTQDELPEPPG